MEKKVIRLLVKKSAPAPEKILATPTEVLHIQHYDHYSIQMEAKWAAVPNRTRNATGVNTLLYRPYRRSAVVCSRLCAFLLYVGSAV